MLCGGERQLRGMFEITQCYKVCTSSLWSGGWFSCVSVPNLPQRLGITGAVCIVPPRFFAHLGFEHKPDHLRSSTRIVHCCIATDPVLLWLDWDIWSYSGCHLFLRKDRSQNWDPWYAHLLAALVAAHHVMWQTKLCTQCYLRFPIKDEQKEWVRGWGAVRFFRFI